MIAMLIFCFSHAMFAQNVNDMMKNERNQQEIFDTMMNDEIIMKKFSQRLSSDQPATKMMIMQIEEANAMINQAMMRNPYIKKDDAANDG